MSNVFAFDHLVHLSSDLLKPYGPLDRSPVPTDADRIEPALDWAMTPTELAKSVVYVIDQPWGISISDITVRASGDDYIY